ncbi:MAG: hypothetical protein JST89_18810 [Cyanobacteria bacterium SZAS-4]|nr:hypothetical protein [Cyanobacteria bacterium SZAS-4]
MQLTDEAGRVVSILSVNGEVRKSFSYDAETAALLSFTNQGYRLDKIGEVWTDGVQVFDMDVSVNEFGVVTVVERGSGVTSKLNPDGSFVITVSSELHSQYSVHHAGTAEHQVSQVDYPDGTSRFFRYDQFGMLKRVDEPHGYWIKQGTVWNHYNCGRKGFVCASHIDVDYNGTVVISYASGGTVQATACGVYSATSTAFLAA